jgi:hypothetical protein
MKHRATDPIMLVIAIIVGIAIILITGGGR